MVLAVPPAPTERYLAPGQIHFGRGPGRVTTLLGSCVAWVLWHPPRALGGMCHYLLPSRPTGPDDEPDERYAEDAIRYFRRALAASGTHAGDYRVALVGGGNMFPAQAQVPGLDVGRRNIEIGRELLRREGFVVSEEHAGGFGHRRVTLDLANGTLRVLHSDLAPPDTPGG